MWNYANCQINVHLIEYDGSNDSTGVSNKNDIK